MKNERLLFVIRLVLFILLACILPLAYVSWRYDLFVKVNRISLSGWGLVGLIIIILFTSYVVRTIKIGLRNKKEYSFSMQVVNGVIKVILPLLALLFIVNAIENSIDYFKQALIVTIICESLAIIVNPLPQWEIESLEEGEKKTMNKYFDGLKLWWKGKDE